MPLLPSGLTRSNNLTRIFEWHDLLYACHNPRHFFVRFVANFLYKVLVISRHKVVSFIVCYITTDIFPSTVSQMELVLFLKYF